jgi:hypothetical protein
MEKKDLPERWKQKLEQFTDEKYGRHYKHRGSLSASDFPSTTEVNVGFPDGSQANFRFSFFLKATKWHEVAVFTEHCGYHIFPLEDLEIEEVEIRNFPKPDRNN